MHRHKDSSLFTGLYVLCYTHITYARAGCVAVLLPINYLISYLFFVHANNTFNLYLYPTPHPIRGLLNLYGCLQDSEAFPEYIEVCVSINLSNVCLCISVFNLQIFMKFAVPTCFCPRANGSDLITFSNPST